MLRIIHTQRVSGSILVDDIDDGLPNKQVHRLGSTADPKAYPRDGYANKPKQPCYVHYYKAAGSTMNGFIDLNETPRVKLSNSTGKIRKLANAGLVVVVEFETADVVAPDLTSAHVEVAGTLTIVGTTLLSVAPYSTSVIITGDGAVTLTETQIIAGGGTVTATGISIPAALVPGIANGSSSARISANNLLSSVVACA